MTPRFTITNTITSSLTAIERARGFLEAATLSDAWLQRMSARALLLEAHHTTHIEGTQLTLEQAQKLWDGQPVAGASADDTCELLNYRAAFNLVAEYLSSGDPITESLIREIQRRLVDGVRGGAGQPGQYRTVQNFVVNGLTGAVVYTPPPPGDVAPLMAELVAWLRSEVSIHAVLIAGIAQFQLVHIHPFVDGNGRTSRLLSTLCLYRFGYDFKRLFTLSEYYDRDRPAFYRAIQTVRERDMDLTSWLEYFVSGLATQMEEVKQRGTAVIKATLMGRTEKLTARQEAVLAEFLIAKRLALADLVARFPAVTRRSLQRDVKALLEKGLLREAGSSPTDPGRHYEIVEL